MNLWSYNNLFPKLDFLVLQLSSFNYCMTYKLSEDIQYQRNWYWSRKYNFSNVIILKDIGYRAIKIELTISQFYYIGCGESYSKYTTIENLLEMPLAYYFHLSRQGQNDNFRLGALFVTFPKSQITLFNSSWPIAL